MTAIAAEGGFVPGNFFGEIAQALGRAEREKRISSDDVMQIIAILSSLDLRIVDVSLAEIVTIARKHNVSAYDAMYLGAALRHNAPLATFDRTLKRAAAKEHVSYVGP